MLNWETHRIYKTPDFGQLLNLDPTVGEFSVTIPGYTPKLLVSCEPGHSITSIRLDNGEEFEVAKVAEPKVKAATARTG